jgi:cobalt-zinc-cadmium efflux system outer membrane protein
MPSSLGAHCAGRARKRRASTAMPAGVRPLLLACASLSAFSAAAAAPAPRYGDLLRQSQATAPRLLESGALVRAAQGLAEQARALPNPTVAVDVEDIGAHDTGIPQRQNTYSVSEPLELGGKRSARVALGRAELSAAEVRQRQAQADFAYDLALAYSAAEAAEAKVVLLTDDLGRARDDLRAARALVEAGKEADLRGVQADAAVAAAEADLQGARADADEALARLTSLAGSPEPFTHVAGGLLARAEALPPPPSLFSQAPAIAVAQAEREAAARRVRVERVRAVPDLTVSVGARTYERSSETALVVGLAAPLPLFDRNRGAVTAATAQLAAADARLGAARLDTEAAWRAATSQAAAGQARLAAVIQGEAAARDGYRLARLGYEAGKTSLLELSAARRTLMDAQNRLVEARLARVRAEAQLARLTGRVAFGD